MTRCRPPIVAMLLSAVAGAALAAQPGSGQDDPLGLAWQAFREGDFARATQLGRSAGTAQGIALAAGAELVEGKFLASGPQRLTDYRRAEQDSRQALALDAGAVEGHLALAIALGFIGRQEGRVEALFRGRAGEALEHIERALALAPANPWAHALLGGWNLEVVHRGGLVAEPLYGATVAQGMAAYAAALALDPEDSQIAYQYSVELLALGGAARQDAAARLLSDIVRRQPADAVGRLIHGRALAMSGALAGGDKARLAALLLDELGDEP